MDRRIVILAVECDATNILVNALKDKYPLTGIIYERPISKKTIIKNRIKSLGLWKVLGQILFIITVPKLLSASSKKRIKEILVQNDLDISSVAGELITTIKSANSDDCINLLNAMQPSLVILSGTRIISQKVLNNVNAVFINIHAGITPLYRGVHGAYWALVEDNSNLCGVTLHYVDKGIDTGNIIAQGLIKPTRADNFSTYPYLQMAEGIRLLNNNLPVVLQNTVQRTPLLTNKSQLRYHPTLLQYLKFYFTKKVK
jgi:methionyl-tRNA formyltransferase